ncbi:hypothetical protein N2152v2_005077 [Parachlorella kessleri]
MAEDSIKLLVKHANSSSELSLPAGATVRELQEQLEARTGVLVRRQKLLCKGKVISAVSGTLAAAGLSSGAKLMLLAGAGEVVQSQGAAALAAAQRARVEQQELRRQQQTQQQQQSRQQNLSSADSWRTRVEVWRKTGIASLRDLKLLQVPQEVLAPSLAGCLRVLDLGGNQLAALPPALAQLSALQRLRLSHNALGVGVGDGGSEAEQQGVWGPLMALTQLVVLNLDHNRLTVVPEGISRLVNLEKLALGDNQIGSLPVDMGRLTSMRALSLSQNQLTALPAELGQCSRLEELDLFRNQIQELPLSLGLLLHLKLLNVDKNKIKSVPPALLLGCTSLATLSLHDNPITSEQLRETSGYAEFDARRKAKYDKQVGMKLHGEGFDEGVDIQEWEHWNT